MSGKRGKNDAADAAAICEAVTRQTNTMKCKPARVSGNHSRLCDEKLR
jgi:transposase